MSKRLSLFTFDDSSFASELFFVVPLSSHHVMYVSALWIVVCSDFVHACGLWLLVLSISVACGWCVLFLFFFTRLEMLVGGFCKLRLKDFDACL